MFYSKSLFSPNTSFLLAVSVFTLSVFSACKPTPDAPTPSQASSPKGAQNRPNTDATQEANILVDEAMLAKPYAIIGGAVENIGSQKLERLSVEIELRRRADGGLERREVQVEPGDLEPGKRGKFSLKVLSEEWSGSRVVGLRSATRQQGEVAFKALPGAKRPPEQIKGNVIVVKTPTQKKSSDSEFINTPDTPYKVP